MVRAIEDGRIQRAIAEQAYLFEKKVHTGEIPWIGVNRQVIDDEEEEEVETHEMDPATREKQIRRLAAVKKKRSGEAVAKSLDGLRKAAQKGENLMPSVMQAVRCYATVGEMVGVLKEIYGTFQEPAF